MRKGSAKQNVQHCIVTICESGTKGGTPELIEVFPHEKGGDMRRKALAAVTVMATWLLAFGCGGDDTTAPPPKKTKVVVDATPDAINAPWALTGPNSYTHNGTGDESITNLTPGDYTIAWGAVAGWNLPNPATQTMNAAGDDSVTFSGTYSQQVGTVAVEVTPDTLNAPWQLTGPNSYSHDGTGGETLPDLEVGGYTLTWGDVLGWDKPVPASEMQTVTDGGTTTFQGTYTPASGLVALGLSNTGIDETGYVRVPDDPALEPTQFTLEAWVTPQGNGYGRTGDVGGAVILAKPIEGGLGSAIFSWALSWAPVNESFWFGVSHAVPSIASTIVTANQTAPMDSTTHVAAVFDGATLFLYVNGIESSMDASSSPVVYYGADDVLIGAGNFGQEYLRRFDGIIDEVRIWDHARSAGEIAATANCQLNGDEAGLIAYWSFEDGSFVDDSGNGHDGAAVEEAGASVNLVDAMIMLVNCP